MKTDTSTNKSTDKIKIALSLGIKLEEQDIFLLEVLQEFHQTYNHAPNMRAFANFAKLCKSNKTEFANLDLSKVSSIYLMQKFTQAPLKTMSQICELPPPENCL